MKDKAMTVSFAPHIQDGATVNRIMLDVIIALIPAMVAAIYVFQMQAAIVIGVCIASCVFFEWAFTKITKRKNSIGDLSAVITGILLGFLLPEDVVLWHAIFGCFVAIVFVKQIFGGLGKNFANPAVTAAVVLLVAFPGSMATWATPFWAFAPGANMPFTGLSPADLAALPHFLEPEMYIGTHSGFFGEAMPLALLVGGLYLLFRRVITWHIPLFFAGTVFAVTAIGGHEPVFQVFSGGLLLGAFFLANDPATSPLTAKGRIIFAITLGLLTVVLRLFGSFPTAVTYSILLMNMIVPLINKLTAHKALGEKRG